MEQSVRVYRITYTNTIDGKKVKLDFRLREQAIRAINRCILDYGFTDAKLRTVRIKLERTFTVIEQYPHKELGKFDTQEAAQSYIEANKQSLNMPIIVSNTEGQ